MDARWLGAMSVDPFLDKYVPATGEPPPTLRAKPFEGVPSDEGKVLAIIYDPFVSIVSSRHSARFLVSEPMRRDLNAVMHAQSSGQHCWRCCTSSARPEPQLDQER